MNRLRQLSLRLKNNKPFVKIDGSKLMIELSNLKKEEKITKEHRKKLRRACYNVYSPKFDTKNALCAIPSYNGSECNPDKHPTPTRPKPPKIDPYIKKRKKRKRDREYKQMMIEFNLETVAFVQGME